MTGTPEDRQSREARETYGVLSIGAWIAVAILTINVSYYVGAEVGGIVYESEADLLAIFNGFWIGIVKAMPTILIAWALVDFARMFGRYSEGDVFTERNVKTLKTGADSLIWAAIWSAIFTPNIVRWIGGNPGGFDMDFRDLALAVGAMGFALHGLALVLRDAVRLKQENDEFV